MAITFTRAATVAPGDPITSTQWNSLAVACNDRSRSGLGDPTWRLHFYWLSLFRQVRNNDGFLWPPQHEFFRSYQTLPPGDGEWPITGPGDPAGANVGTAFGAGNQMMSFVFGAEYFGLHAEDERLSDSAVGGVELYIDGHAPVTASEFWELAKLQRGAYDIDTGALGAPALTAARSFSAIRYSPYSPHGNSYGHWQPGPPKLSPNCDDPDTSDDYPFPPNLEIKFTNLDDGSTRTYDGTCVQGPDTPSPQYDTHIAGILETQWAYYVVLWNGTVDELLKRDWIEGPYTGEARLKKRPNDILPRVLNTFAKEFRGTEEQYTTGTWNGHAFDFQRFLRSQYHLAPQRGVQVGDVIYPTYPRARFSATDNYIASGSTATYVEAGGGSTHVIREGFLLTGFIARASKLVGSASCTIFVDDVAAGTATMTADANGDASAIFLLKVPKTGSVKFKMGSNALLSASDGYVECELAELVEYKPEIHDLYCLLRLAGAKFNPTDDGIGTLQEAAKEIGDNYFSTGCIVNYAGHPAMPGSLNNVNFNAVFDAARRMSMMVRMIPRDNIIGLDVVDGQTSLYFTRYSNTNADLFDGIAPPLSYVASGSIVAGETYQVRADAGKHVAYNGTLYTDGETFTGLSGVTEWQGEGFPYIYNGIREVPLPQGYSNEWMMGTSFNAYRNSDASIWKAEAYSDYFPFVNRCLFYSPEIAMEDVPNSDGQLLWHTSFGYRDTGVPGVYAPEAPSGFNYARLSGGTYLGNVNVNKVDCGGDPTCEDWRRCFYKSCRVYEPDGDIESVTILIEGGAEVVKVTFKGRLHSTYGSGETGEAPASIDRDTSTWVIADIAAEPFRSVENGLREYLMHVGAGMVCTAGGDPPIAVTGQPGNASALSDVQGLLDKPFGSCYPLFMFTKLVPTVYEDGNDKPNAVDTKFFHDGMTHAEYVLRAMCEGYVDPRTSATMACDEGTLKPFHYTFENLCFDAFGGRWFGTLPTVETSRIPASETRPDEPQGFGPIPNVVASSEIFNQFSAAVNKLVTVSVMLPMKLQYRETTLFDYFTGDVKNADGDIAPPATWRSSPSPNHDWAVYYEGATPMPSSVFAGPSDWTDYSGDLVSHSFGSLEMTRGPITAALSTTEVFNDWQWTHIDPDSENAIPELWRDMLTDNATILGRKIFTAQRLNISIAAANAGTQCNGGPGPDNGFGKSDGTTALLFTEERTIDEEEECGIYTGGTLTPPDLPASALYNIDSDDPLFPDAFCSGGNQTNVVLSVLDTSTAMVTVPLVEYRPRPFDAGFSEGFA